MPTFRAPRGTRDLLPAERAAFRRLETIASDLARRYGYREIETPMFEQTAVFERGVGEVTDVVEKELFRIAPRTEESESWALRPEPTAGIVRAYVQHGMQTLPQPVKLTMTGPMFRHDRPQAGRYRQFWQFDVEVIGDPGPAIDAEIIELAARFYEEAGIPEVVIQLNSIGDPVCRPAYIAELAAYYEPHRDTLPAIERERLDRNVLRLLDGGPGLQPADGKEVVLVVVRAILRRQPQRGQPQLTDLLEQLQRLRGGPVVDGLLSVAYDLDVKWPRASAGDAHDGRRIQYVVDAVESGDDGVRQRHQADVTGSRLLMLLPRGHVINVARTNRFEGTRRIQGI